MSDGNPGTWESVVVGGHACDVFEPVKPSDRGYVVIYLHGVHLGTLRDYPTFTRLFDEHGLRVICPVTQRSWWTDRICAEFDPAVSAQEHLHGRVLPYVALRWGARPPRIALLGTSMGGQGALRQAYKFPDVFPIVAAISPAIDYHLRYEQGDVTLAQMYRDSEDARQDTAILHVHPLNWPRHQWFSCDPTDETWFDSADRLHMKLASLGIPHECDLESTGGGHAFDYYQTMAPAAIRFIVERLEQERLRLV
jgi:S-formylglutathione hydrolase FrmB